MYYHLSFNLTVKIQINKFRDYNENTSNKKNKLDYY